MKRKAPQYKPTARKSTRTVSRDTLVLSSLIVENEEINPEQSNILNEGELMTDDEDQQLINELNRIENNNDQETISSTTQVDSQSDFLISIDSQSTCTLATQSEINNDQDIASTAFDFQEPIDGEQVSVRQTVENSGWISEKSVFAFKYKYEAGITDKNKIAAFDLDGTLITPKSKSKFSKDINDWKLLDGSLKRRIQKLVEDGFNFVIFSNQMGVSNKFISLKDVKKKFENVIKFIGQPCVALLCTSLDKNRKPATGMLDFYRTINRTTLNLAESFYVGDAMGRLKDHSAADLLFAFNCKLPFIPIESFLSGFEKPKLFTFEQLSKFRIPKFPTNPINLANPQIELKKINPGQPLVDFFSILEMVKNIERLNENNLCVLLLIGLSGSGKTFFVNEYLNKKESNNYQVIDQVAGRNWEDEKILFKNYVNNGIKRIVIDQPNLNHKVRENWINFMKGEVNDCNVFGIQFRLNVAHCAHNVRFRNFYVEPERRATTVSELLKQQSAFREPEYWEKFKRIYLVDFIPLFSDSSVSNLKVYYSHFLYDKP